jgi:hypothetical protein
MKGTTIVVTPPEDEELPMDPEDTTHSSSIGHSSGVFSEKSAFEREQVGENRNEQSKRRRRRKITWALSILVILLLAIVIGLAVGLSRKDSKRYAYIALA